MKSYWFSYEMFCVEHNCPACRLFPFSYENMSRGYTISWWNTGECHFIWNFILEIIGRVMGVDGMSFLLVFFKLLIFIWKLVDFHMKWFVFNKTVLTFQKWCFTKYLHIYSFFSYENMLQCFKLLIFIWKLKWNVLW